MLSFSIKKETGLTLGQREYIRNKLLYLDDQGVIKLLLYVETQLEIKWDSNIQRHTLIGCLYGRKYADVTDDDLYQASNKAHMASLYISVLKRSILIKAYIAERCNSFIIISFLYYQNRNAIKSEKENLILSALLINPSLFTLDDSYFEHELERVRFKELEKQYGCILSDSGRGYLLNRRGKFDYFLLDEDVISILENNNFAQLLLTHPDIPPQILNLMVRVIISKINESHNEICIEQWLVKLDLLLKYNPSRVLCDSDVSYLYDILELINTDKMEYLYISWSHYLWHTIPSDLLSRCSYVEEQRLKRYGLRQFVLPYRMRSIQELDALFSKVTSFFPKRFSGERAKSRRMELKIQLSQTIVYHQAYKKIEEFEPTDYFPNHSDIAVRIGYYRAFNRCIAVNMGDAYLTVDGDSAYKLPSGKILLGSEIERANWDTVCENDIIDLLKKYYKKDGAHFLQALFDGQNEIIFYSPLVNLIIDRMCDFQQRSHVDYYRARMRDVLGWQNVSSRPFQDSIKFFRCMTDLSGFDQKTISGYLRNPEKFFENEFSKTFDFIEKINITKKELFYSSNSSLPSWEKPKKEDEEKLLYEPEKNSETEDWYKENNKKLDNAIELAYEGLSLSHEDKLVNTSCYLMIAVDKEIDFTNRPDKFHLLSGRKIIFLKLNKCDKYLLYGIRYDGKIHCQKLGYSEKSVLRKIFSRFGKYAIDKEFIVNDGVVA